MGSFKILAILCIMADCRQLPIRAAPEDDKRRVATEKTEKNTGYIKTHNPNKILKKESPSKSINDGRSKDQIIAAAETAAENGGGATSDRMASSNDLRLKNERLADTGVHLTWPKGIIPFKIQTGLYDDFTEEEQDIIYAGMQMWMNKTCIKFVKAGSSEAKSAGHNDYILIVQGGFCLTEFVGYRPGQFHIVALMRESDFGESFEGCINPRTVARMLGHVIGLRGEQTRKDRDQYIRILYENVNSDYRERFEADEGPSGFGTPYDFCSIMHYSAQDASISKERFTIVPKDLGYISVIGRVSNISYADATIVNRMYNCSIAAIQTPCLRKLCTNLYSEHDCKNLEFQNKFASLPASNITTEGERCNEDRPCGKHGESYYWCGVASSWNYCCAPGMSCGNYGYSYVWCWADYYESQYNYCKSKS